MTEARQPKFSKPVRYNPLDPAEIGRILRERLEQDRDHPFPPNPFQGAGLYALYYVGEAIREYEPLANAFKEGRHIPVYVGKAEAGNSNYGYEPNYDATNLSDRIAKHAASVSEVEKFNILDNLRLTDFRVKFLSLDDAWIVLGERALLRAYRPVLWNTIVSGFGSNPPGAARNNARSVWDTIHPGRERAGDLPNRKLTFPEMKDHILRGVEISLMDDENSRDRHLAAIKNPPTIWAQAPKKDPDQRIRVQDEPRFLTEIERLGLDIPEYVKATRKQSASSKNV